MGFLAEAIPIAVSVLGAMSKSNEQKPQQPAVPPPPGLGEIFAMNEANRINRQREPFTPGDGQNYRGF